MMLEIAPTFLMCERIQEEIQYMTCRIIGIVLFCALIGCKKEPTSATSTSFTKADSLTEFYLTLQDSMLRSWNIMTNDDNQKIAAMHSLLRELELAATGSNNSFDDYKHQIERLNEIRYDRSSLAQPDVVEEYDFASNLLVSELISLAETHPDFTYNHKMQQLVDQIRIADQRVNLLREEYDGITARYNAFIRENHGYLSDIAPADSLDVKPLFEMSSAD